MFANLLVALEADFECWIGENNAWRMERRDKFDCTRGKPDWAGKETSRERTGTAEGMIWFELRSAFGSFSLLKTRGIEAFPLPWCPVYSFQRLGDITWYF